MRSEPHWVAATPKVLTCSTAQALQLPTVAAKEHFPSVLQLIDLYICQLLPDSWKLRDQAHGHEHQRPGVQADDVGRLLGLKQGGKERILKGI